MPQGLTFLSRGVPVGILAKFKSNTAVPVPASNHTAEPRGFPVARAAACFEMGVEPFCCTSKKPLITTGRQRRQYNNGKQPQNRHYDK